MEIQSWLLPVIIAIGGFLAGYINTLAGSGSFISLPLLIFSGLDPVTANGTNRVAVLLQNIVAAGSFHRKKFLDLKLGLRLSVPAVAGSVIGAFIAVETDPVLMGKLIGIIMLVMIPFILMEAIGKKKKISVPRKFRGRAIAEAVIFFLIGVYGGFIQAGIGIFLLLALDWFTCSGLMKSNALKLFINLCTTLAAMLIFAWNMKIDLWYSIFLSAGNISGAWLGARTAFRHGAVVIRWALIVAVSGSAVKLIFFP